MRRKGKSIMNYENEERNAGHPELSLTIDEEWNADDADLAD
jgi:hypothetical protein